MKPPKKYILIILLLPVQVILVQILSRNSSFIERYYSNGLYPFISKLLRILFGWLPFSVGDALGIFVFILLIRGIYKLFKHRFNNIQVVLIRFMLLLSVIYSFFYCFWGLNYFREPLAKNLNLKQSEYTTEELLKTTYTIVEKLNKYHLEITQNDTLIVNIPYTTEELYQKALVGYKNMAVEYPQLAYKNKSIKSSLVSLLHSYSGTSGYINPLTNEAQINNLIPKTGMPTTICHEMGHQIGWAAENDANFIGFLASKYSEDIYFKYAAYKMSFTYLIREVKKRNKEEYQKLWKLINKGIIKDYNRSYTHWQQFKNPIEPYIKKGYNSYLKANKQQDGIKSYSYVVDLLIAYYKKEIF